MKTLLHATDTELIQLFQNGNGNALEILVTRHKSKIFSSIRFIVKDKYLAEDIFQDVFFKIIDTLRKDRYNDEGKFLPWALRIAHNLCVDHFRKLKRTPIIKTSEDRDLFDEINVVEESSETKFIALQTQGKVRKMLEFLPEEQREVLVLRHFANMSFKEIAGITKCSINTSLGRMRYGLINLRRLMEEKQIAL